MKLLNQLACLLVIAAVSNAWAEDAKPKPTVKIVNETKIFALEESRNIRENNGVHSMRLSPDGKTLLYIERLPKVANQRRRGYRLHIRDIKTGKDTVMPGAPSRSDDFLVAYASMYPFDATGKNLVIPIITSKDNKPVKIGEGEMQLGIYDIATGKLDKLDMKAPVIFPSYDATGKNLIVFEMFVGSGGPDMELSKIVVSPVDKIKFKKIGVMGMPRSPCPTGDILPILLPPERKNPDAPRQSELVIYDTKADKKLASPPLASGSKIDDYNPQWTTDGRYLYYIDSEIDKTPDGDSRYKRIMRVWDRKKSAEVSLAENIIPIGPAPGKA
ncbi:MAG: hypothetical protein GY794_13280, partial [bacterium]|nr:hypothetical protein [bacterium]